jgi:hypothetical protein
MAAKPTLTYTWALSGTATEPTVGKKASGWSVGERPPAPSENWLNQANGAWITYLNGVFTDITTTITGGGTRTTEGLVLGTMTIGVREEPSAGLGRSFLSVQASGLAPVVESASLRALARYEFHGAGLLAEPALRLDPTRSPLIAGPHAAAEWVVFTAGAGKVIVRQGAVGVDMSAAEAVAAGADLDEALNRGNLVKAHAEVVVTLSGGVFSAALRGSAYNVASVSYPTTLVRVTLTDFANVVGQIRLAVRPSTGSTSTNPIAVDDIAWDGVNGRVEFSAEQLTGGAWQSFHVPATPSHEMIVTVTVY